MAETRHVKLNYDEALFAKKQLLSTELNFLQTVKKIRTYKQLRKKEIATKNKLRTGFKVLKTKLNLIQSSFPDEEKAPKKIVSRVKKVEKKQKEDIKRQLDDIKSKLAKLK